MAKKRVYELAKDLNTTNRGILNIIKKHTNVEVKSHISSLENSSVNEIVAAVKKYGIEKPSTTKRSKANENLKFIFSTKKVLESLEEGLFALSGKIGIERQEVGAQLKIISGHFKNNTLVFVLGAGVSIDHNLPSWNDLLQRLLLLAIANDNNETKEKANILSKVFNSIFSPDPLKAGRYLYNKFSNDKDTMAFEEAVRHIIYSDIDLSLESDLFKEIRQFCIAPVNSPNLDSIITYNYDELLEYYLKQIDIDIPYSSIYAPGMKHDLNSLAIYHVHGFLPRKGDLTGNNKITLSEDIYHQQYSDIYGWSNLVQINKFKDCNCLFVGISLSDPNLRRLLDIAKKLRGDDIIVHYCIKKRYHIDTIQKDLKKILDKKKDLLNEKSETSLTLTETAQYLIDFIEDFEIKDARSLGVDIVWVDDYEEIPNILEKVRLTI